MIYYEDLVPGTVQKFGAYNVTREEVLDFAQRYDPQAFHLSDEEAAKTHFGRIAASGWHTCAMAMRMSVDFWKTKQQAGLGSPGVDEIRWIKPVYPGDTLRCEQELLHKRRSQSRPEMGIIKSKNSLFNQNDELVMSWIANGMIRVRNPDAPMDI